jgi:hypothetical protein
LGLEERCLALLLHTPELLATALTLGLRPEVFEDVRNRTVFETLCRQEPDPDTFELAAFAQALDTALAAHVESLAHRLLAGPPLGVEPAQEDLKKCVSRLRKGHVSRLLGAYRFMQQDAQEQGATEDARRYNAMIDELTRTYLEIERQFHAATLIGRKHVKES